MFVALIGSLTTYSEWKLGVFFDGGSVEALDYVFGGAMRAVRGGR